MQYLKKLLFEETNKWLIQFFRYFFVGGFSFIVDYGFLYILTEYFNLYYLLSATISFLVGLIVNYLLSIKWIFKRSKLNKTSIEFLIYGLIGGVGLFLNNMILYFFTDIMDIYYLYSKFISAFLVMGWNFFGRRIILFKN